MEKNSVYRRIRAQRLRADSIAANALAGAVRALYTALKSTIPAVPSTRFDESS
jgi:hypothetical protein